MKTLLFLFFFLFCAQLQAQNYMMSMNVQETVDDSTTYSYNTKVIWGAREREICLIWNNKSLHFYKHLNRKGRSKAVRKAVEKYTKENQDYKKIKALRLRELFSNQWGELFLITVYMEKNTLIIINRVDGKFPHYSFNMVLNKEP